MDSRTLQTGAATDSAPPGSESVHVAGSTDVFIKSFVFSPEVPIRIDYEAKWFHSEQVVSTRNKRDKLFSFLSEHSDRYPPWTRSSRQLRGYPQSH